MKNDLRVWFVFIVFSLADFASETRAFTDPHDVRALRDLYWNLNFPTLKVGDWTALIRAMNHGVEFRVPSLVNLRGLNLNGTLGYQLNNLQSLKTLDVSFNNLWGPIPDALPPIADHINLAYNNFNQSIPATLSNMKHLRHLNISHNSLSGHIGDVFNGMGNLNEMDLSFNGFSGDLPSSFGSLKNLSGLFLQNNNLTGSVSYLAQLPLIDLNIQNNDFSGIIPSHFESIPNLWIGGNRFHTDNSPPWDFPMVRVPKEQIIIHSPPTYQSSTIERNPAVKRYEHKEKKKGMGLGGLSFIVGGGTLVGVLLLELLTGRKPFDNLRAREEQSLVKWASSGLHDNGRLERMVDPEIKRSVYLSRLADIVSLCIQVSVYPRLKEHKGGSKSRRPKSAVKDGSGGGNRYGGPAGGRRGNPDYECLICCGCGTPSPSHDALRACRESHPDLGRECDICRKRIRNNGRLNRHISKGTWEAVQEIHVYHGFRY